MNRPRTAPPAPTLRHVQQESRTGATTVVPVAALGVLGALASIVLLTTQDTWRLPAARQLPVDLTVAVTYPVMAVVVLSSGSLRPGARAIGWILAVAGGCAGAAALATALALGATDPSTEAQVAVQAQAGIWVPGFMPLLTLVPLYYPDGLLPGRVWRGAAALSVAGIVTLTLGLAVYPEPFVGRTRLVKPVTDLALAQGLTVVSALLLVPAVMVALASLVVRFRRSRGLQRRQVVVLLVAAGLLAATTALQGLLPSPADVLVQAAAAGLVPVAIGVAVTRHGLYELDTAVARALVVASLGACLAGAYVTVFAVLQSLPEHRSTLSAALAAGVTGVVVQPLGRRLAAGVDRMYYGDRADPFAITSQVASRLTESGLDVARVPQVVCDTVVEGLRLPGAALSLRVDGADRVAASAGEAHGPGTTSFALRHAGEVVGRLDVRPRTGERALHERDEVVVRSVADQVSPAVAALRLHEQLKRSREELVSAREDERLQLRRDLHDGLGATLAGLRLQVETARDLADAPGVPRGVGDLLGSAAAGVAQAVAEVRAVTDGLRPAGIDELGLPRALVALADRVRTPRLDVAVHVDDDLSADPAVQVALHRIAAEALANVARHAGARSAELRVQAGPNLLLEVCDDGRGVRDGGEAVPGSGLGLASMRQRAEEVGGTLDVTSSERGTTVRAVLPRVVGELR